MPEVGYSNRKMIQLVKQQTDHNYAWLNSLLKFPHSPETALLWAYLARFVEISRSVLICAKHKDCVALACLLRVLGECAVRCKYIFTCVGVDSAVLAAWVEKRKLTNKVMNQLRSEYETGQIATAEMYNVKLQDKIAEFGLEMENVKIQEMWRAVGEEKKYHLYYTLLSAAVHSSIGEINNSYMYVDESDVPFLTWSGKDECAPLLGCWFVFYEMVEPMFVYLSNSVEKLMNIDG